MDNEEDGLVTNCEEVIENEYSQVQMEEACGSEVDGDNRCHSCDSISRENNNSETRNLGDMDDETLNALCSSSVPDVLFDNDACSVSAQQCDDLLLERASGESLNVEDNIKSILEIVETDKQVIESNLDQLLTEFDISHLRRTPSLALSGGERRRVEIARCLAGKPNYILLDEPFAGIDPIALGEIKELVAHLKDKGVGVLITDHNVRETMGLIDRAVLIHEGSVLIEGKPEDIIKNDDVRRVYLGERFSI